MPLSAKTIAAQLALVKPLLNHCSLETSRRGQKRLGELMEAMHKKRLVLKDHPFDNFTGAWMIPKDERRQGVIFYLHGGGYTCGDLDYAKGFGAVLADECGVRVFCAAYRLAPEHPFPAALEDALEGYRYLLKKGYDPARITLCGESAGGGLCYALCLKLKQLEMPLPGSIVAISPWTDLTASGPSYETNRERDPSMTEQQLSFYAECYTEDRENPLVSPLFGDLKGLPPSLLFVGGDEIMLSDTEQLHGKLLASGCSSHLVISPERWHAYVLFNLRENREDFVTINRFLNRHMYQEKKLQWVKLDNAAKIYPAALRKNWSNVFRLSATLNEPVDKEVLSSALDVTVRRFPTIAARLRKGVFWYYLQQLPWAPELTEESSYPLVRMTRREIRRCAFRVIAYNNRISVEFFHALTDGNGALVFLKTLTAEYLQQKYGIAIPAEQGVLGRLEEPTAAEMEDSFQKYSGPVSASRRDSNAWHLTGTPEKNDFLHLTCFQVPADKILEAAHAHHVTATAFLTAALMAGLLEMQKQQVPVRRMRKPVKVLIPVNLRRIFPSSTLRNFAMYTVPEVDPRLGEYTFDEICQAVHHRMGLDINAKHMSKMIAANVSSERLLAIRILPLFLKNAVMKAVFNAVGEKKSCMGLSNLGVIRLPKAMEKYVERMDFILSAQATAPHNCGVLTYGNTVYINFIRNIQEPDVESCFFRVLREMGIPVLAQSNEP